MWNQQEDEDENDLSGYDLPVLNSEEFFLSPEQTQNQSEGIYYDYDGGSPPQRVMSSHSLAGEDFILSARPPPLDFPTDIALSPFTPSDGTQTPPISLADPVTPPRLNPPSSMAARESTSPSSRIFRPQPQQAAAVATTTNSLPGRMRPPRVPQVSLHPARGNHPRHGRGLSNSEFSFLSALTDGTSDNHSHSGAPNSTSNNVNNANVIPASSNISVPRRRTVSWDFNEGRQTTDSPGGVTNTSTRSTPANLLQPILSEELFGAPPASIVTDSRLKAASTTDEIIQGVGEMMIAPSSAMMNHRGPGSSDRRPKPSLSQRQAFGAGETVKARNINSPPKSSSSSGSTRGEAPIWNPAAAQDTGSFIATSDNVAAAAAAAVDRSPFRPVPRQQPAVSPPDNPLKRYTVDEVMDAYPQEPPEETLLMSRIESRGIQLHQDHLIPDLPAVLSDLENDQISDGMHEDEKKDSDSFATPRRKNQSSETFGDIAKKLLDGSPLRPDGSQGARNNMGRRRNMHHRQATLDTQMHAGDKLYEAAETLFGHYANSMSNWGSVDEEKAEETAKPVDAAQADRKSTAFSPRQRLVRFRSKARKDLEYFAKFLGPHKSSLMQEIFRLVRLIMIPSLCIASILYYGFENPPTGYLEKEWKTGTYDSTPEESVGILGKPKPASLSWWFLFCGVRQVITLELARLSQLIVIDFFTLRTRTFPRILGPSMALMVAQSKGWPYILTSWALWDFALLFGEREFVRHWAYWQSFIGMMNATNPAGDITSSGVYTGFIFSAILVGIAFSIKRAVMGQLVGKRVVRNYREEMARLMKKLILLNDVSQLALQLDASIHHTFSHFELFEGSRYKELGLAIDVEMLASNNADKADSFDYSDAFSVQSREKKKFTATAHIEIMELLEEWEEPELQGGDEELINVGTILQFRRAITFIGDEYPFSRAFGSVRTRENCVTSAQQVFERLMTGTTGPYLNFDVLCLVAKDSDGNVNRSTVKELIRVFRPNRNGQLSKLDFVKSVDSVYKSLRLLLASINNSQQIDKAYETIVNVCFAICMGFIAMAIIGVNIQALLIGLGSLVVSFAFMIGPASSKYLEGILFVLARKPYDIGDRVNIDEVTTQPDSFGGESSWIVENVDLFTTTARLGTTRELATFSNGSLAMMRIMNLNRSDKPNVYLDLKFSVDSTLQQRQMFKRRMIAFVKERPREWIRLVDFRSTSIEAHLGYVQYVLILQHREKWQNLGAVLSSRGEVFNYAVEVQKDLDMKYRAPHVPIDIRRVTSEGSSHRTDNVGSMDLDDEPKKEK